MSTLLPFVVAAAISVGGTYSCVIEESDFEALRNADSVFVASINDRYRWFQGRRFWDLLTLETLHGREELGWQVEYRNSSFVYAPHDRAKPSERGLDEKTKLIFAVRISEQWVLRNFNLVMGAEVLEAPCHRSFIMYDRPASRQLIDRVVGGKGN